MIDYIVNFISEVIFFRVGIVIFKLITFNLISVKDINPFYFSLLGGWSVISSFVAIMYFINK